ncbi:MAG TPA: nickel-dependent lactate racemase [Spirochaetales bacterium]|jgi:nickel-dependent lactate racemase|nr:nickel-dependent lactate racemase [Spirochaetales bacterium]
MKVTNPLGSQYDALTLPEHTFTIQMETPQKLTNVGEAILDSFENPIASKSLKAIAKDKLDKNPAAKAAIIISDNTRPVPYKGEEGILLPILETLFSVGYDAKNITILIATGTHRAMSKAEIAKMIDERVLNSGVAIVNHDCKDESNLVYLGDSSRGTRIMVNKLYVDADLKIATGLVESHFMAGASGGRKAVCPGLIGEQSTFVFHGVPFMADPASRDLNLKGNPVHMESLEVAKFVGVDFLVNVTLGPDFHVTGVFSGDLDKAHLAAVDKIAETVRVPAPEAADIVITHGGFVGINHYQCAKCAVASLGVLKKGGYLVIIADTTDEGNVVGGINYITTLALLKLQGAKGFLKTIGSPDWTFLPEQWQVQMWAKVFDRIDQDHMLFYSPSLDELWWPGLPGINGKRFLPEADQKNPGPDCFTKMVSGAIKYIESETKKKAEDLSIVYISDGPYVIPYTEDSLEN